MPPFCAIMNLRLWWHCKRQFQKPGTLESVLKSMNGLLHALITMTLIGSWSLPWKLVFVCLSYFHQQLNSDYLLQCLQDKITARTVYSNIVVAWSIVTVKVDKVLEMLTNATKCHAKIRDISSACWF